MSYVFPCIDCIKSMFLYPQYHNVEVFILPLKIKFVNNDIFQFFFVIVKKRLILLAL